MTQSFTKLRHTQHINAQHFEYRLKYILTQNEKIQDEKIVIPPNLV